jgi:hypothetical protein
MARTPTSFEYVYAVNSLGRDQISSLQVTWWQRAENIGLRVAVDSPESWVWMSPALGMTRPLFS